jgi:hypothetical protein
LAIPGSTAWIPIHTLPFPSFSSVYKDSANIEDMIAASLPPPSSLLSVFLFWLSFSLHLASAVYTVFHYVIAEIASS